VFTARYALSPYIKQLRFVFKGLKATSSDPLEHCCKKPTASISGDIAKMRKATTIQPCYNDIGLYDISVIASGILWYQLIPRCYHNFWLLSYNNTRL
jgi:hypothetical protein